MAGLAEDIEYPPRRNWNETQFGRLMELAWKAIVDFPVTEHCRRSSRGRDRTVGKSRTMIGAVSLAKGTLDSIFRRTGDALIAG